MSGVLPRYKPCDWIPHFCGMTLGVSAVGLASGFRIGVRDDMNGGAIIHATGYRISAV